MVRWKVRRRTSAVASSATFDSPRLRCGKAPAAPRLPERRGPFGPRTSATIPTYPKPAELIKTNIGHPPPQGERGGRPPVCHSEALGTPRPKASILWLDETYRQTASLPSLRVACTNTLSRFLSRGA